MYRPQCSCAVIATVLLTVTGTRAAESLNFNRDIRPILSNHCFDCHGFDPKNREAELRLDTYDGATAQLESGEGQAIVPGKPEKSILLARVISHDVDEKMPPEEADKPLTKEQVALLRQWIIEGAKYERHWSFVAPVRPDLPTVSQESWARNPVDRFIFSKLEKQELSPSPEANKATLIRRLSLDLIGLPPTPAEVKAFIEDESKDAYEKAVDRLLASPRYGERMAQRWLDIARYADTMGYQADWERTQWRWRSWVIDAYNRNLPFDQFTIEQIAGDMLPGATIEQKIASGFNRNHRINAEAGIIPQEFLVEYVVDRVETTSTAWMGLTMGCARCHDHKYDPISQREFYQLFSFFYSVPEKGRDGRSKGHADPAIRVAVRGKQAEYDRLVKVRAAAENAIPELIKKYAKHRASWQTSATKRVRNRKPDPTWPKDVVAALRVDPKKRTAKQRRRLTDYHLSTLAEGTEAIKRRDQLRKELAEFEKQYTTMVMVMSELKQPRQAFVLDRGTYDRPTEKVSAGVPKSLPQLSNDEPRNRLALARWLASEKHPLTARVAVNRHWSMLMGTGLVATPEDFGLQGEWPSHPALLDWLATEYVRLGWNTKKLLKLIVTSSTYRQSSAIRPKPHEADPKNRLLARMSRVRLPAEIIRDQALYASGLLVEKIGGPSVKPYQPPGLWAEFSFQKRRPFSTDFYDQDRGEKLYRRSIYTFWKRSVPPPSMATFDAPSREMCIVSRPRTNTPLQALALMNDVTYVEAASSLAARTMSEIGTTNPDDVIRSMFLRMLSRSPDEEERTLLRKGYERRRALFAKKPVEAKKLLEVGESAVPKKLDTVELAAYSTVAMTIMNLDESINRE